MRPLRPPSVTAAAVLAIIYGTLSLTCNLCGLFGLAAQGTINQGMFGGGDPQQAKLQKDLQEAIEREVPGQRIVQFVVPGVSLVLGCTLLAAGIGIFAMRSWARMLGIVTALLAIAFTGLQAIFQVIFVMPATNNAMANVLPKDMPKGPPGAPDLVRFVQISVSVASIVQMVILAAVALYLAIIVLLLVRRTARAAFAAAGLPPETAISAADAEDEGWGQAAPPRKPEDDIGIQKK